MVSFDFKNKLKNQHNKNLISNFFLDSELRKDKIGNFQML